MSLRRRIAGAAAIAAALVALAITGISYASTRSHLVGEVQQELWARARVFLSDHDHERQHGRENSGAEAGREGTQHGQKNPSRGAAGEGTEPGQATGPIEGLSYRPSVPPPPAFGGATGYFQFVYPDGTVMSPSASASTRLPVDDQVLSIARHARGSFFSTATVESTHLEVLTVGDPFDHYAVQVALPLSGVDSVLHGLLVTYALLVGGGILVALLLGIAISRSALAPIERFLRRTEAVTSDLDKPRHLEETGAGELRRLAASFNQTLDALERSMLAQRHLVADASHELRTPIASLRSNIQIFLDSHRLPQAEREGLQNSILAELDELTQVVADVVELARGSAPGTRTETIELDAVVQDAVERARRRTANLNFQLDLEPTAISGVSDRVARAVTNVIDNARKWSPHEASVSVELRDGTLTVRDHGPGFAQDDLPHVFDRFYRAESARRLPGSGLGLAIVKQAAESHGGFAQASNAPDGGAVVRISFGPPLQVGRPVAYPPPAAAPH
jgi:two-component system sensor histidine kinase MprB